MNPHTKTRIDEALASHKDLLEIIKEGNISDEVANSIATQLELAYEYFNKQMPTR